MPLAQKLDFLLHRAVDDGDVPGVVAMATNAEEVIYQGAFGKRALGGDQAMTLDTVVWIASMTKSITGAAVMQLVEQGRLDLDRPASTWVPDLASVQVLEGFDSSGTPRTRPPKRPITLRHLLTHTAGYGYPIWSEALARYYRVMGLPSTGSCEMAALRVPLLFDPGERWGYGINLEWAGKAVEAISGKKLSAYLQENLFGPLGMHDTAFKITPSMRERLAKLHERGDDGTLRVIDFEVPQEPETEMGGGGLYSTAGDYLKFVQMILNRGRGRNGRVLKARDGGSDVAQSYGRSACDDDEDLHANSFQRRGGFPGRAQDLGPQLHDQRRDGAYRSLAGKPLLGGTGKLLLLDRSVEAARWGLSHADLSVRR